MVQPGAKRNDLVLYLETFAHTVGVMQHRDAIERVAYECAVDLAADGVVYAEVRMAPELCTEAGLTLDEAVEAMLDGFRRGAAGTDLTIYLILSAMRTAARSREIAELAVRWRDEGVVGFDIAGAEEGYPPTHHLDAFDYVRRENFHTTIHAGEAFGLPSIWEAVQFCGAERLGHGVRIVDDITGPPGEEELGRLAAFVRDRRIPLELCPTSNVGTGVCKTIADHPIGMLRRLRFRVTVNTDNRLMSATSMTYEMEQLHRGVRLGPRRLRVAHDQRDEECVRPLPRAAAHHQRSRQAALRAGPRRTERRPQLSSARTRRAADMSDTLGGHDRRRPPRRAPARSPTPSPGCATRTLPTPCSARSSSGSARC